MALVFQYPLASIAIRVWHSLCRGPKRSLSQEYNIVLPIEGPFLGGDGSFGHECPGYVPPRPFALSETQLGTPGGHVGRLLQRPEVL